MKTIAIVGLGKIARDQHLPALTATGAFRLAGVVSPEGRQVEGVPTFATQTDLLRALPGLDAVAICSPPAARYDLACEAIAAGCHVLLEKPPAATLSQAADLEARAAAAGRTLFAAWHSRFNPAVAQARELLQERRLRGVAVTWKEDVRRWHPGQDWIFAAGGFGVFDPGINALSICTAILPFPLLVESAILRVPANRVMPIAARLDFHAPPGLPAARVAAEFDFTQEGEQTWSIEMTDDEGRALSLTHGGANLLCDGEMLIGGSDGEYPAIYRHFAALVESGRSDVDLSPLRLVEDAFVLGRRQQADAFFW